MKRILATVGATSLALMGATATAFATGEPSDGGGKITICHATGSETNPYVPVTINLNGLKGHVGHQHHEDIIPANNGDVLPQGQNLDKVDWWNAGCSKPGSHPHHPGNGHGNGDGNDHKITICHATGSATNPFVVITIALQGLSGHAGAHHQHSEDIIPPNSGGVVPAGQNWTAEGQATYNNGCVVPAKPPVVPPVVPPVMPPAVVVPPAPPAGAAVPVPKPAGAAVPAPKPAGAAAGGGAGATVNQGFNVQTAVSEAADPGLAPWLGGVAALLLAGAAVAARRTPATSGSDRARHRA